jgi:hypothetical protein
VGFIDDEEDVAPLARQVVEGRAQLWEEAHKAKSRFDLEGKEDFAIEGRDAEMGVGEIDHRVEIVVEGLGKGTDGGRFSCSDIAGEESGETVLQSKGEAALDLAVAA